MDLAIVLVLVILNGALAASELAIVSARRTRLQARADAGDRRAATALELAAEPDRFLSTVQIGITLIGILAGTFGGAALTRPVGDWLRGIEPLAAWADPISVLLVVGLITYLSLVIGELVPKRLALLNPEGIAVIAARPMRFLSRIAAPVVSVLAVSSDLLLRLLGARASGEPPVTEEEVEMLLQEGARHGVFAETERAMAQGVFDLGDRTAAELMTPRHRVVALDLRADDAENRRRVSTSHDTDFPVCDGSLDEVIGIAPLNALWEQVASGRPLDLRAASRPPLFVPESAPVLRVLEQMRAGDAHLALVVDEYGGIEGRLTLDDLMAFITGDIDDAAGIPDKRAARQPDGSWRLDGALPAHDVRDLLDIDELPGEEEGEFETLAGFLMARLGHIPSPGDTVAWDGWRFTVTEMAGNRVVRVDATRAMG